MRNEFFLSTSIVSNYAQNVYIISSSKLGVIPLTVLEATTFINTLSVAIAEEMNENELILISAILTQIADTLETISAIKYNN